MKWSLSVTPLVSGAHCALSCLQEMSHTLQNLSSLKFNQPPRSLGESITRSSQKRWASWGTEVRGRAVGIHGREVKRHQGTGKCSLLSSPWRSGPRERGDRWGLSPIEPHVTGSGTTFCCYSSLPGSSSLSSPSGNALADFWTACIRVSIGHSWLRIACSKRQEKSLNILTQSLHSLPS